MFKTRADIVVNFTYLVTLIAPLVAFFSLSLVRKGEHNVHKWVQIALLTICVLAVGALETRIRLAGGSGTLLQGSPYAKSGLMRSIWIVHVLGAVSTYLVWGWLVITSYRRHRAILPGTFSRRHKMAGWIVIGGLCFTALSATIVYILAFTT
ncbi:MAG: hypothetical protein AB1489_43205 [Acidobacteriota bacterium]